MTKPVNRKVYKTNTLSSWGLLPLPVYPSKVPEVPSASVLVARAELPKPTQPTTHPPTHPLTHSPAVHEVGHRGAPVAHKGLTSEKMAKDVQPINLYSGFKNLAPKIDWK